MDLSETKELYFLFHKFNLPFLYLLKNSTIIEPELDENLVILKYLFTERLHGFTRYIIGSEKLLNCLKPYF